MEIKCGSYGAKLIETNLWRFPETTEKNAMTRSKKEYPLVICSIAGKTAHLQFSVASALSAYKQNIQIIFTLLTMANFLSKRRDYRRVMK